MKLGRTLFAGALALAIALPAFADDQAASANQANQSASAAASAGDSAAANVAAADNSAASSSDNSAAAAANNVANADDSAANANASADNSAAASQAPAHKASKHHSKVAKQVNINTATAAQLAALKGVGKTRAEAIIKYRTANGNFTSVDDLSKVDGVTQKIIDENRSRLTLG